MILQYIINVKILFIFSVLFCLIFLLNKNKIYFLSSLSLIIFLWIPYIFDQLFVGRIVTNINDPKEWFSFLSGYLGSGFGAIATLIGIFYQLNYTRKMEDKNRLEGLTLYLKYCLEDILESSTEIIWIEQNIFFKEGTKSFFQISENFLKENIKLLFSLGEITAKEILNLFLEVFHFNKLCLKLKEIKKENILIEEIINIIKENEKEFEIKEEILEGMLKIKSIFDSLNSLLSYKYIFDDFKDNFEVQNRIKEQISYTELILLIEKIKEIANIKYIKNRKYIKVFLNNSLEKINCKKFKEDIFNGEVKEEEILEIIAELKEELVMNIVTIEEKKVLEPELYLKLMNNLVNLKTRFKLEKKIVNDKEKIRQKAQVLITKL